MRALTPAPPLSALSQDLDCPRSGFLMLTPFCADPAEGQQIILCERLCVLLTLRFFSSCSPNTLHRVASYLCLLPELPEGKDTSYDKEILLELLVGFKAKHTPHVRSRLSAEKSALRLPGNPRSSWRAESPLIYDADLEMQIKLSFVGSSFSQSN